MTLRARADEPLLMAIERAGIAHPTGCRRGACQTCRVRKISGATSMDPRGGRTHVTVCTARPREDVELDL